MVLYKVIQETNKDSKNKGQWKGRAVHVGTIDTNGLISEIEKICTVSDADVVAVIRAMVFVMTQKLQESYRVKIDGFGAFKIGLKTTYAEQAKDFTATKNIVGSRVNFSPETHWTAADGGQRRRVFLEGLKVTKLPSAGTTENAENEGGEGGE